MFLDHVMQLTKWLPDEYGIFFTYYVQHFDSIKLQTDSTQTMEINTIMVVAVSRKSNLQNFKFEGVSSFIPLGKFVLII